MKRILTTVFVIAAILILGCKKEATHYVRIKNNYIEDLDEVKLDEINYGKVDSGAVTGYKYVLKGTFPITITTESGSTYKGSAYVDGGNGEEHWTVTVTKAGAVVSMKD